MSIENIHRAVSRDGTEIAGRTHGEGPPLVFISSALGDDITSWGEVALALAEGFSCYPMSTRGRGQSGDHPDHSPQRLLEDVVCFVESIGAPAGLVGHSSSGALALEVAAKCTAVSAVAVYEPTLFEFADEEFGESVAAALGRVGSLAEQGRFEEAALAFVADAVQATDDELQLLASAGAAQRAARYIPVAAHEIAAADGLAPMQLPRFVSDLSVMDDIEVPTLLLHGSGSLRFWRDVAYQLARRIPRAEVRRVDGVAHLAPLVAPAPLAAELGRFFGTLLQPARAGQAAVSPRGV